MKSGLKQIQPKPQNNPRNKIQIHPPRHPHPQVRMKSGLKQIQLNPDGSVKQYDLLNGEIITGDLYVSAMPGKKCFSGCFF